MDKSFGTLFSELLKKYKVSGKSFAQSSGFTESYVSKIKKDKKTPTLSFLLNTLNIINLTSEEALELFTIGIPQLEWLSAIKLNPKYPNNIKDTIKNKMLACILLMLASDELRTGPYVSLHLFSEKTIDQANQLLSGLQQLAKDVFEESNK